MIGHPFISRPQPDREWHCYFCSRPCDPPAFPVNTFTGWYDVPPQCSYPHCSLSRRQPISWTLERRRRR